MKTSEEIEMEVYDHLAGKPSLVVYMIKQGEGFVTLPGGLVSNSSSTRILKESYDYRSDRKLPEIGYRLTVGKTFTTKSGERIARDIPTEWVVTSVERYEASEDNPAYREIIMALCESQPLSLEDFRNWVTDDRVVIPGDKEYAEV
jgi:hypothetical protein